MFIIGGFVVTALDLLIGFVLILFMISMTYIYLRTDDEFVLLILIINFIFVELLCLILSRM